MADDEPIDAVRSALANDPSRSDLRRLLMELLLASRCPEEALAHARHLLADEPDDLAVLDSAARAAEDLNDFARAERYRRASAALTGRAWRPHSASQPRLPRGIPDPASELLTQRQHPDERSAAEPLVGRFSRPTVQFRDLRIPDRVAADLDRSLSGPDRCGIMLYGPPGCGKTTLARAIAGELGARIYEVRFSDVIGSHPRHRLRNLTSVFEAARSGAPCVLFLDEAELAGTRRSQLRHDPAMRTLVNHLIEELDGLFSSNPGVVVVVATEHPWDLDAELLHPARLGSAVFVRPPDAAARRRILADILDSVALEGVDLEDLVTRTAGYSCAELDAVAKTAMQQALDHAARAQRMVGVDAGMLRSACRRVKPGIGAWASIARGVVGTMDTSGRWEDLNVWLHDRR